MAGSYRHVTDGEGRYLGLDMIDDLGDASEALEECVMMIRHLTGGDKTKIYRAYLEGYLRPSFEHHADTTFTEKGVDEFWEE